jgi:hypothetical protein
LLKHIVITDGNTITFYLNKPNEYDSPEFNYLKKELSLQTIRPEANEHESMHHPYREELVASNPMTMTTTPSTSPHAHFSFKDSPQDLLKNVCRILSDLQNNPSKREQTKSDYLQVLENLRRKNPARKIPKELLSTYEHFDTTTPFMPLTERTLLLNEFERYCRTKYNLMHYVGRIDGLLYQVQSERDKLFHHSQEWLDWYPRSPDSIDPVKKEKYEKTSIFYKELKDFKHSLFEFQDNKLPDEELKTRYNALKSKPNAFGFQIDDLNLYLAHDQIQSHINVYQQYLKAHIQSLLPTAQSHQYAQFETFIQEFSDKKLPWIKTNSPLYWTLVKYNKVAQLKEVLTHTSTTPTEALTQFAGLFFNKETNKPLDLFYENTSSIERQLLTALIVILSGVLPGILALSVYSYQQTNSFAFWKMHDSKTPAFCNQIEDYVAPPLAEAIHRNF